MKNYDFLVVGGGMVGAAIALGIAKQGMSVGLIERHTPKAFQSDQPMDLRVSAISPASVNLLSELGVWERMRQMRVWPYSRLETWENEQDRVCFDAESVSVDALGYMVENRIIQLALWEACEGNELITLYADQGIAHIYGDSQGQTVELTDGIFLKGQWLVGADGANSQVRAHANIGLTAWDYRHHCLLINVETQTATQDVTWQCFTPKGPRSFLPLGNQRASLVLYDSPQKIQHLSQLNDKDLRQEILMTFPAELGEISIIQHASFPLTRRHAQQYFKNRTVLLGDAAHTINPLAGQGVNLGFKDVKRLLKEFAKAKGQITEEVFYAYERKRMPDNLLMQSTMDVFYVGFSNDITALKAIRNLGLGLAQKSDFLKKQVLKYAMGL